jgi:hypothetical protein
MTTQTIPDSLACKECEDKGDAGLSPAHAVVHEAGSQCFGNVTIKQGLQGDPTCCPRPAPSRLPTRIVDAVATPKGKLMNRNTHSVSIAVCASSSTVPAESGLPL